MRNYITASIDRPLPSFGVKNISIYYAIMFFSSSWFIIGSWLFFALNFVTAYEMSVLESVSFGIGLLLEVPSGAIADLIGKKKTIQIGLFMQTFGMILFIMASLSKWYLIFGNIIIISSFAFLSGSLEALAYDSLVEQKKEKFYDVVAGRVGTLTTIATILTAVFGGVLYRYNEYYPWYASIFIFSIALLASFKLKEPSVDTYVFSWSQFVKQNKIGFSQLISESIRKYIFLLVTISATFYMWNTGIIQILVGESFGYNGETLSYLIGAVSFIAAIVVFNFEKIKTYLGNGRGLTIIGLSTVLGWAIIGIGGSYITGAVVFLVVILSGKLMYPWTSSIINRNTPSKYRATTISTLQFFVQIPYVIVVVFFGKLVEQGIERYFYYGTSLIVFFALLSFLMQRRRDANAQSVKLK